MEVQITIEKSDGRRVTAPLSIWVSALIASMDDSQVSRLMDLAKTRVTLTSPHPGGHIIMAPGIPSAEMFGRF